MRWLLCLAACARTPVAVEQPAIEVAHAPTPVVVPASGPRWIGVAMAPGTTRIENVFAGSPAAGAGLHIGDELIAVDGVAVTDATTLRQQVAAHPDGARIPVAYRRAGNARTTSLVSAPMPDTADLAHAMIGKPAPGFSLSTFSGAPVELAALHGTPVLLDFWATWCRPCEAMRPQLEAFAARHREIVIIALSSEDAETQHAYLGDRPARHPWVVDEGGAVQLAYLADRLPTLVLVDANGIVTARGIGSTAIDQLHLP